VEIPRVNTLNSLSVFSVISCGRRLPSSKTHLNEENLILDPFMIHEAFPFLTETASGSYPCCIVSVTYDRTQCFHGGNTGSNPVGDANLESTACGSSSENA
jgi:hypothetical protein